MVKVAIIGAGIMGACVGYRLLQERPDIQLTIMAKEFSPHTTSDGAAGFWEPYLPGDTPAEKIWRQSKETYEYCMDVLKTNPQSPHLGLSLVHGYRLSQYPEEEKNNWSDIPNDYHPVPKHQLRKRFPDAVKSAVAFTTIFIENKKLVPYYMSRIKIIGGKILQREITSIDEIAGDFDLIVNCTGLGSRVLVNDQNMFPIRGQILRVRAPWVKEFVMWQEKEFQSYILPNQNYVVLGGTAHISENTDATLEHKKWILESTKKIMPSLEQAELLDEWVGFRPARKGGSREEVEDYQLKNGKQIKVVHCYGHGGSGLTIFWGCAGDTVKNILSSVYSLQMYEDELKAKL